MKALFVLYVAIAGVVSVPVSIRDEVVQRSIPASQAYTTLLLEPHTAGHILLGVAVTAVPSAQCAETPLRLQFAFDSYSTGDITFDRSTTFLEGDRVGQVVRRPLPMQLVSRSCNATVTVASHWREVNFAATFTRVAYHSLGRVRTAAVRVEIPTISLLQKVTVRERSTKKCALPTLKYIGRVPEVEAELVGEGGVHTVWVDEMVQAVRGSVFSGGIGVAAGEVGGTASEVEDAKTVLLGSLEIGTAGACETLFEVEFIFACLVGDEGVLPRVATQQGGDSGGSSSTTSTWKWAALFLGVLFIASFVTFGVSVIHFFQRPKSEEEEVEGR